MSSSEDLVLSSDDEGALQFSFQNHSVPKSVVGKATVAVAKKVLASKVRQKLNDQVCKFITSLQFINLFQKNNVEHQYLRSYSNIQINIL